MDHGGRPPTDDAETFPATLLAFKEALLRWQTGVPAELWKKNRDYIKACDRWK